MKPTLCTCPTWKILCSSSLTLEAGKLSTNVSSMVSMAARVCKGDKSCGSVSCSPSQPRETDVNSQRQGRTPALPCGAWERPKGRQSAACRAACGTGCGQAQGKGTKG